MRKNSLQSFVRVPNSNNYTPPKLGCELQVVLSKSKNYPDVSDDFSCSFQVKISGVTGNIEFGLNGTRRNFQVQLLDVGFLEVHSRVGNWSESSGRLILEPEYSRLNEGGVNGEGVIKNNASVDDIVDVRRRAMRITAVMVRGACWFLIIKFVRRVNDQSNLT